MSAINWEHPFTGHEARMCSGCFRILNEREEIATGASSWVHSAEYAAECPGGEPVAWIEQGET